MMKNKIVWLPLILIALLFVGACDSPVTPAPQTKSATATVQVVQVIEGEISLDRNFYLIVDDSDSMASNDYAGSFPKRIEAAKWALEEFVTKAVPSDVNLGLYALNSGKELVPLGKNRDLNLRRTSIIFVSLELLDERVLFLFG